MLYNPALVAIAGVIVWLFIRFTAPLEMRAELQWNTLGFIATCYISFFVGCIWARQASGRAVEIEKSGRNVWSGPLNLPLFWTSFVVGCISMAFRVYDRVGVRGISYLDDSSKIREALENTDFSGLSAVSSVIMPFCFMPFILLLACRWQAKYFLLGVIATLLFCLPMLESLAQASRSIMLLTLALGFTSISLLKFGGRVLDRRVFLPLLAGSAGLLLVSSSLFQSRLGDYGRDLQDSLSDSVYAQAFLPSRDALDGMSNRGTVEAKAYETILPNAMYYLSGLYEFELSFNRPDGQIFSYGSYILYPYSRVLALVFGTENIRGVNDGQIIYRTGVFTSFFGPMWVDFGWTTPFLMLLFGFYTERLSGLARQGYLNVLPFYLFCLVVILYMPVFNFLVSGFGFFIFHGFALFALFSSFSNSVIVEADNPALISLES